MKLFHKAVLFGTTAVVLLAAQTNLAHADQKGGGSRGGSASKSSGGMSNGSSVMKMSQGNAGRTVNTPTGKTNTIQQGSVQPLNKTQGNVAKLPANGMNKAPINTASKMKTPQNYPSSNNFKNFGGSKNYFCGTPWSQGGCFPSNHHYSYCGFGYGWNNCWSYPCYNHCYPSYYSCYTPCYDYCYTTPVYYTCQTPVVMTQRVVEVVQPAPIVETVTTTTTATAGPVQPSDISFLTNSATGR